MVGLIPGPSEPPLNVNSYLEPLVKELNQLWDNGINIKVQSAHVLVKSALLCVSCNIPASRKVCGFLGHGAKLGCSKCFKMFPSTSQGLGSVSYAGFDDENYPLRNASLHREHAQKALDQITPTARAKIERDTGARYTALMQLSYFDCIRMHVIDPMHNLFLGTAKHMMKKIWMPADKDTQLLSSKVLSTI